MSKIYILENDKAIVKILSLGAILHSFIVKELDTDIALGYNEDEPYLSNNSGNMGKCVGRCANRIGKGIFTLEEKEYHLLCNNGVNSLHGGEVNFGNKEWIVKFADKNKITLTYHSKDMEAGYPGNLDVETTYELNGLELIQTISGVCDKTTLFNMTNHSYFNLDKNKTNMLNHYLKVHTDRVNLNDENGMARDLDINVKGTLFDFTDFKKIGDVVNIDGHALNDYCIQLANGKSSEKMIDNIDNNFVFENKSMKTLCELKNDKMKLTLSSDLPDVQIYTGKSLNKDGKDTHYNSYAGIAMEPQFVPNAINYNKYMKPILKANEKATYKFVYKVDVL